MAPLGLSQFHLKFWLKNDGLLCKNIATATKTSVIKTTNWAQIFTGLLFYACSDTPSEKTGLWQLPMCPVSLNGADWTCVSS